MARLTSSQQRQILREAARQLRAGGRRGVFSNLGKKFGPFGELLGILVDAFAGGRNPGRQDVDDAIQLLLDQGFQVSPGPAPPGPDPEPPVQAPPVHGPIRVRGGVIPAEPTTAPAFTTRVRRAAEAWPAEHTVETLPVRVRGAYDLIPPDVDGFSPLILTPQSSNVYGVMFDYENQILYVQFRAPGEPIGYKESVSVCSGKRYKVAIRPNIPGPIYSYGGAGRPVPTEIFDELATSSTPGRVVWDRLRVCGSHWQHQFPYSLTDIPSGQYVPRKATRRGLRVRTVPTVGVGRRGGRRSTMPERIR